MHEIFRLKSLLFLFRERKEIIMSNEFIVSESSGEKLYKLIMVLFSPDRGMKIISKEIPDGRIHFRIYFGNLDPDSREFLTRELKYKSVDEGATKEEFDELLNEMLSKMPEEVEIKVHDLSQYSSLMEQFSTGVMDGFFNIRTTH